MLLAKPNIMPTNRLITGAVLGLVAAFALYLGGIFPVALAFAAVTFAAFEYWTILQNDEDGSPGEVALQAKIYSAVVVSPSLAFYFAGVNGVISVALAAFMLLCAQAIFLIERPIHEPRIERFMADRIAAFFILLVFCNTTVLGVAKVSFSGQLYWLWAFAAGIIACDTGAYFVGKAIGKEQLAPRLSPGKTKEGLFGGLTAGFIVALTVSLLAGGEFDFRLFLFCLSLPLLAVVGDLFQSAIKRGLGVKDSGSILPGHGGVFDRIDSWLFASPLLLVI